MQVVVKFSVNGALEIDLPKDWNMEKNREEIIEKIENILRNMDMEEICKGIITPPPYLNDDDWGTNIKYIEDVGPDASDEFEKRAIFYE